MSARDDLLEVAAELGLDPTLDDRQLAVEVLAKLEIDLDRPAAPMSGDTAPIREHSTSYLVGRALRTARYADRERRTEEQRRVLDQTLGASVARRWLAKLGLDISEEQLVEAVHSGDLRCERVGRSWRFDPEHLTSFARWGSR
ncbi:MAG: hypothetical protein KIT31_18595 [Deltaproteobacteria bacterium]|nr:hypothetical protein [Deltaproteobacteria bacterium]